MFVAETRGLTLILKHTADLDFSLDHIPSTCVEWNQGRKDGWCPPGDGPCNVSAGAGEPKGASGACCGARPNHPPPEPHGWATAPRPTASWEMSSDSFPRRGPQLCHWPFTPNPPRPPSLPPPVGVPVAHGVMTRVLLILLRHLEAHFLAAPVVGPVHLALFADQLGG